MEANEATTVESFTFTPRKCPCGSGKETSMVHLGTEPPKEIGCGFGCDWDGRILTE